MKPLNPPPLPPRSWWHYLARRQAKLRRWFVILVLFGLMSGLTYRLIYLQSINSFLVKEGMDRAMRVIHEPAMRGMILDRNGEPLAISTAVSSIVINPQRMWKTLAGDYQNELNQCADNPKSAVCATLPGGKSAVERLARYDLARLSPLAKLLGLPPEELYQRLQSRDTRLKYYLMRSLAPSRVDKVMALKIPGLWREDGYQRFYPNGDITGQVVGFTNFDGKGQSGAEQLNESWLRGKQGSLRVIRDLSGNILRVVEEIAPATPGLPITLSIDKRIQFVLYNALQKVMAEFDPESAEGIVVDVQTGEILAMVALPAGNPNNPSERVSDLMRNRVMSDPFEPGSVMKPIAMAAALQAGVINTRTLFHTDGSYKIGDNTVRDDGNYGTLDAAGVIRKSSNIGMSMISQRTPRKVYYNFLRALGFGQETPVHFPGESAGRLRDPSAMGAFEFATTMFGYGLSVTAAQIAQAYATLANDGVKVPLTLLKRNAPVQGQRVLSRRVAQAIDKMLVSVVERGTGTRAQLKSYSIAGKTGTVHKVIGKSYSKNRYRSLFAGFAPAQNPRIVVVIVVDDPKGGQYFGGQVAAPAFAEVAQWTLKLLGVLPDKLATSATVHLQFAKDKKP